MEADKKERQNAGRAGWLRVAALILVAAGLLAAACGDSEDEEDLVQVVTTLELFGDFARQAGGDRVEVTVLLPSGADPHTFELTPDRVADIADADIVVVNGLGLEGNLLDVIDENADGEVVELSEDLDTLDDNPHLWLDAENAIRYVEKIRDALVEEDGDGIRDYVANTRDYVEELEELDDDIEEAMEAIPEGNRKLVTFHDAFPYLADRYGLEIVAVVVPSPGQDPSAQDVAGVTEALRSEGVRAAFSEPQFDSSVLDAAADDAGVDVLDLLSDSFVDLATSYIELMEFNLAQLEEGLGGS